MSNLHEDACLLSTQITLQAVYHEIWGKRWTGNQNNQILFEGEGKEKNDVLSIPAERVKRNGIFYSGSYESLVRSELLSPALWTAEESVSALILGRGERDFTIILGVLLISEAENPVRLCCDIGPIFFSYENSYMH